MDDAIKKAIEASIIKLLHDFPNGLTTSALTDSIDEAERPVDVSAVLGDMRRRGLVVQYDDTKAWMWVGDANGKASAPSPERKLHECAAAILATFEGRAVGTVITAGEFIKACSQWPAANVGYHIKALKKAGLMVMAKNGKGYHLPGAAPSSKAPARRPNTALLSQAAARHEQPTTPKEPAPIPPPAPEASPAAEHDIGIEMTCPNGRIKLSGTPTLVFGFLEQLKALAA